MARWQTKTSRHKPVYESNTFEFVNEIHELVVNSGDILVSYDVSSLFTNVPLEETIQLLADKAFINHELVWWNVPSLSQ